MSSDITVGEESCIGSSACLFGKSDDRAHNVCIQMKMTSTNIYLIFDKGEKKVGDKSCRGDYACYEFTGKPCQIVLRVLCTELLLSHYMQNYAPVLRVVPIGSNSW
jgi:hypothetical protein